MGISAKNSGKALNGKEIFIYTLTNDSGMKAEISSLGATVTALFVPDKNGFCQDVALGFEKIESYFENGPYLGATIGRHANRLEDACFELDGTVYKLAQNDGRNHLHGGSKGFDKVVWDGVPASSGEEGVVFSYTSRDGEENYPGKLAVKVTYTLTPDNALKIDYYAISDKDTVVNLTNHCYFNLSGHDSGDILRHNLMINADYFTPIGPGCLPTGEIRPVEGTVMDFRDMKAIAARLESDEHQIVEGKGYDHNFVLNSGGDLGKLAAEAYDPVSGRRMAVYTTKPGIQFYSGNYLDGSDTGKNGAVYKKWSGFCLETQYFPNAMKHKNFPSPILKKDQEYKHTTIYKFISTGSK